MKKLLSIILAAVLASAAFAAQNAPQKNGNKQQAAYPWTIPSLDSQFNKDEANFARYAAANAEVKKRPVAVFMGDSITDGWARTRKAFFEKNNYIGRGISGQVTSQMLVRFRKDVIELKPQFVLILAGTNDIARNRGYIAEENIVGNIISMCEIAKANNITPIICSILPAARYKWRPEIESVQPIKKVNAALEKYARENNVLYLDYYSKLVDANSGLAPEHSRDGVHPTSACFAVMEALAKDFIEKAQPCCAGR